MSKKIVKKLDKKRSTWEQKHFPVDHFFAQKI